MSDGPFSGTCHSERVQRDEQFAGYGVSGVAIDLWEVCVIEVLYSGTSQQEHSGDRAADDPLRLKHKGW